MSDLIDRLRAHAEHYRSLHPGITADGFIFIGDEAADRIEVLEALARQYRDDLHYPLAPDSRERRIAAIDAALPTPPVIQSEGPKA